MNINKRKIMSKENFKHTEICTIFGDIKCGHLRLSKTNIIKFDAPINNPVLLFILEKDYIIPEIVKCTNTYCKIEKRNILTKKLEKCRGHYAIRNF